MLKVVAFLFFSIIIFSLPVEAKNTYYQSGTFGYQQYPDTTIFAERNYSNGSSWQYHENGYNANNQYDRNGQYNNNNQYRNNSLYNDNKNYDRNPPMGLNQNSTFESRNNYDHNANRNNNRNNNGFGGNYNHLR